MTVNSRFSSDEKQFIISIEERFDFSLHQQFRDTYNDVTNKDVTFILDLSKTEYMDSSALGMILLLKDHVQACAGQLIISKPSDSVRKILEIAQFQRLMIIE